MVASVAIRSAPEWGDLCASTSAAVCHRIRLAFLVGVLVKLDIHDEL
jgi:hypothetical protein